KKRKIKGEKMKKTILTTLAFSVVIGAAVAQAGNIPEFDAVCDDSTNYFAATNSAQYGQVIANNIGPLGPLELVSCWPADNTKQTYEEFTTTAGWLYDDPVFPGMLSALTDVYNEGTYHWNIVLQMKPESDLNINIYDSVLKHNEFSPWTAAEQTGRYRAPWGQLFFVPSANPQITVQAIPGKYHTPKFEAPVTLDARAIPGLQAVPLSSAVYTSKCLWADDIVVVMPETGTKNTSGQNMYNLKQGDMISVDIAIPGNNTADIRYGQDSVTVKYIGIIGTWLYAPVGPVTPQ
ncbi:MAG: hypothetical protein J0665_06275, partial [Deltaproteobacteria bacterium]|nr:hypothetical protein [Deltaproteobacteria bacterium]